MRSREYRFLCYGTWLVIAVSAVGLQEAGAQSICLDSWSAALSPALFRDVDGEVAIGARLSAQACHNEHDTRESFSRSTYIGASADAALPFASLGIPQNVEVSAQAGLSISLSERRPIDPDDDPDTDFYAFNYGFAAMGGRIQYESSANLEEQAVVGGLELRWVDPRRSYLPSLAATIEGVKPVRSELRSVLGMERSAHARVDLRGYWLLPLHGRLFLELDAGYFRAFGLDEILEQEGLDRGGYIAPMVGYGFLRPIGPVVLRSAFVEYARGRRPTGSESERSWMVGLEIDTRR